MKGLLLAGMLLAAGEADAVALSFGRLDGGREVALTADMFEVGGGSGRGASFGDGARGVAVRYEGDSLADGRHNPGAGDAWVDSRDYRRITMTVRSATPFSSLSFASTDAADQGRPLDIRVGDEVLRIDPNPEREPGGVRWVLADFGRAVRKVSVHFVARHRRDGHGVSDVCVR